MAFRDRAEVAPASAWMHVWADTSADPRTEIVVSLGRVGIVALAKGDDPA